MEKSSLPFPGTPWVIKPLVPDEYYTDRTEFLDYFYHAALNAATRRTMSTVLLGQRRMGKTEIFRRVVNRLFFEQDPQDPKAVVPVYFLFPGHQTGSLTFALRYVENFMRYYFAFHTRRPEIIRNTMHIDDLIAEIEAAIAADLPIQGLNRLLGWYKPMREGRTTSPPHDAVEIPRRISDSDDSTIVMFLDEFQNTHLPNDGFNVVAYMQEAVESNTCPHFVTGSAMSILTKEILGRGALYGRFRNMPIEPLSGYWGTELVKRVARHHGATISELMAPVVSERCGGNPFYISALIQQAADLNKPLFDEETINSVLAIDISSGYIWAELYEQVNGWIERINQQGITKWILYLSVQEEGEEISLERVQQELKSKEGQDVPIKDIKEVLIRLSRGDLLDYKAFGNWFGKVDDPILLEFIKVWGQVELERYNQSEVRDNLLAEYASYKKRITEYRGYLGEIFMSQVLLSSQDISKLPLPGRFFNSPEDIQMPRPLSYVRQRVTIGAGKGKEIDVLGAIGTEKWVCQSKWHTTRKMGVAVLEELMAQAKVIAAEFPKNSIHMWIFAHEGLTKEAEALAKKKSILWSNRAQLDGVLEYLDLRPLPHLDE